MLKSLPILHIAPAMADPDLQALARVLDQISLLTGAARAAIMALAVTRRLAPGQHLLRAGETATQVMFVAEGLLREYYIDGAGRESTRRFCQPGEFSGSLADLLAGGPSAVSIEALETTRIIDIEWARLDALAETHPCLMKLMRRFAEGLYVRKMRREFEMLTMPAAQRYARFVRDEPGLNARLPRHMVASYLGITQVHLSRLGAAERLPRSPAMRGRKK